MRLVTGALLAVLAGAVTFGGADGAAAQARETKTDDARQEFLDFGEMELFGFRRTPSVTAIDSRRRAAFDRLARLKKSFVPSMLQTGGKSPAYR